MQASHHTIAAHRLVVLHEVDTMPKDRRYFLIELSLREALEEVATGVFEDAWLNDEDAGDICIYYFHYYKSKYLFYINTLLDTKALFIPYLSHSDSTIILSAAEDIGPRTISMLFIIDSLIGKSIYLTLGYILFL